jgi:hypothetical protein
VEESTPQNAACSSRAGRVGGVVSALSVAYLLACLPGEVDAARDTCWVSKAETLEGAEVVLAEGTPVASVN